MPAPANDNLANATAMTGSSGSLSPITIDSATVEGGELGSSNQTIWFKFHVTSAASGVHVSTQGSAAGDAPSGDGITPPNPFGSLDTNVHVYETTVASPTYADLFGHTIATNDDEAVDMTGALWSDVTFNVLANRYYFVQVGTFDVGYTGTVLLNWNGIPIDVTATPSAVAGIGAVPAATGGVAGVAFPARVAGIGAVPAPTVVGGFAATASPVAVVGSGHVPHPYAVGAGTGGGGGSIGGVTDFWAIKALG